MTRRDILHAPRIQALKRDTRALISAAGGVEDAATFCRPAKSVLSDYQSTNTDSFIPADVIADLEAVTHGTAGHPIMTRRLATMAGCSLVTLPKPGALNANWFSELGRLACDHGKLSERLCEAASDGIVTADEVRDADLISVCDDAILHLVNLRARFERITEEARR